MIRLELTRKDYGDKQTRGIMDVFDGNLYLFTLSTLEQEWNNNETSNSCIPFGFYIVKPYKRPNGDMAFILEGTSPRTYILIHKGNLHTHTEGCILVGLTFDDINNDGLYDVVSSGDAMDKLLDACKNEKVISINIK